MLINIDLYLLFSSNNLDYNKCLFTVSLAGPGQGGGSFLAGSVVKYPLANSRETGDMRFLDGKKFIHLSVLICLLMCFEIHCN